MAPGDFADCLSVCCTSVDHCGLVEVVSSSAGTQSATDDEPPPSSGSASACASTCAQWHFDEPGMPEVVGRISEGSVVHSPQRQSPLEIKSNVLRGVPANVVLRRCARLLSTSAGSEATYRLSRPTDHLATFISHNWSVGRGRKWLALSLHYNFPSALVCGLLTAAVLCAATSMGWLPLAAIDDLNVTHQGIYCCVSGFWVFHLVLFFCSDLPSPRFLGCHEVFLDKACIHQVDKRLQREGIESLGGFLYYSWSMVVLYTPVYTKKLWTVYEMACFLNVHPGGRLVWLPVDLASAGVAGSLIAMLVTLVFWGTSLADVPSVPDWLLSLPLFPCAVGAMFLMHSVARDQAKSEAELRLFSIRNAICAVEGDRAIVEGNVVSLTRHLKLVSSDSTHEEALLVFDRMVQNTMPRAVRDAVGGAGTRYELLLTVYASSLFVSFDRLGAQLCAGASVQATVATVLGSLTYSCAILPLSLALLIRQMRCRRGIHLSGWRRTVFLLLAGGVWTVWLAVLSRVLELAPSRADEDLFACALLCLVSVASFVLTYFVFRRPAGQQRRRRTGVVSETMEELAEAVRSHSVSNLAKLRTELHGPVRTGSDMGEGFDTAASDA